MIIWRARSGLRVRTQEIGTEGVDLGLAPERQCGVS